MVADWNNASKGKHAKSNPSRQELSSALMRAMQIPVAGTLGNPS